MAMSVGRRQFIAGMSGMAAWPLAARAQPAGLMRIGDPGPNIDTGAVARAGFEAFRGELRTRGLREGVNVSINYKDIDDPRGLPAAAAELMQSRPDILVTAGPEIALQAAIAAKRSVPIVMIAINFDPIARGYVKSLSRPGATLPASYFSNWN